MKAAMTLLVVIVLQRLHVMIVQHALVAIHVALAMPMLVVAVLHVVHVASLKLFDINFNWTVPNK